MVTATMYTTRAVVKVPKAQNMHLLPVTKSHILFLVEVTRELQNFRLPTVLL
jgi:hypothetical protein